MDKLKQIESFASVATKGSLTAAAQAEGVAPAVIGRRIDALEARLGVKLLVRTTRRISLTHEGLGAPSTSKVTMVPPSFICFRDSATCERQEKRAPHRIALPLPTIWPRQAKPTSP